MRAPHTERLEQPQLVGKKGRLAPEQTGSAGLTYEDMINVNQSDSCPFQYSYICHVVERDFLPEVAFDVPERSCDWVHKFSRQHEVSIHIGPIADLIAIAVTPLVRARLICCTRSLLLRCTRAGKITQASNVSWQSEGPLLNGV